MPLAVVTLALALAGQASKAEAPSSDAAAERLALMKDSVQSYAFTADGRDAAIALRAEPAFRLGRQAGGILEGAIFLWTDPVGRPEAAAQVFLHRVAGRPQGEWHHEFTSLSTRTFAATQKGSRCWWPAAPGVAFGPLPGAPKPAESAPQRLRQMRALAQEFHAEDDFGEQGWIKLRLLPTPIARYGKPGATPEDGALFAFVEGTDPEVFLFVEARPGPGGPEWQYACAPMSCWPLRAERTGQVVWSLPLRFTGDPSKPFFDRTYEP